MSTLLDRGAMNLVQKAAGNLGHAIPRLEPLMPTHTCAMTVNALAVMIMVNQTAQVVGLSNPQRHQTLLVSAKVDLTEMQVVKILMSVSRSAMINAYFAQQRPQHPTMTAHSVVQGIMA